MSKDDDFPIIFRELLQGFGKEDGLLSAGNVLAGRALRIGQAAAIHS